MRQSSVCTLAGRRLKRILVISSGADVIQLPALSSPEVPTAFRDHSVSLASHLLISTSLPLRDQWRLKNELPCCLQPTRPSDQTGQILRPRERAGVPVRARVASKG